MSWPGKGRLLCTCNTHMLTYERDELDGSVSFALWTHQDGQSAWRQRLRHIWRIVRWGEPYADWFSLSKDEAHKLGQELSFLSGPVWSFGPTSGAPTYTLTTTRDPGEVGG